MKHLRRGEFLVDLRRGVLLGLSTGQLAVVAVAPGELHHAVGVVLDDHRAEREPAPTDRMGPSPRSGA